MNLIKTKSFELAVTAKGNQEADKIAIVIPGRLDSKDYVHTISHVNYLSGRGFFAFTFDPPGVWDSPGSIELYTTTNYLKSIDELIEYFDNRPTLLLGFSRGGAVAMLSGAKNKNTAGIIAIMATYGPPSPPGDEAIRMGFKMSYRDLPPGTFKTEEQKQFALPINYFEDGAQYDPVAALKAITKPKLLFYGTGDTFTQPEKIKKIFEDIPEPKMIYELDSEHDYRYRPQIIEEVNKVTGQFLDRHFSE